MNFYMKQRVFSWRDKFHICDEDGNEKYYVEGAMFSIGKRLTMFDAAGNEVAEIRQKVLTFLPKYHVQLASGTTLEIKKCFTLFRPKYGVEPLGWTVQGDFWAHEYRILCGETPVAAVNKEWFAFGDAYHIDIAEGSDEVLVLSVLLVVDACIEMNENT